MRQTLDRRALVLGASATLGSSALPQAQAATPFGRFVGPINVQFDQDGRHVTLLSRVLYIDGHDLEWPVPLGWSVDGASIPQAAWSFIGGPFEGKYRDASIVHDYYCDTKHRRWAAVHRMFYDAMRCRGVDDAKALLMYGAVYAFGPRWTLASGAGLEDPQATIINYQATFSADLREPRDIQALIDSEHVRTPEEIEASIDHREISR